MIKEGDLVFIWNPKKGDSFLIKVQPGQSQGTHFGQIKHSEIMEHNYGEGIRTPKGQVYYLLRPTLGEYTRRLKRQTQIVFPKEAGFIIEHLNIFPGCTVVECGTGSGSLCCTFAHFVGSTGAGKTTITNLINRFYDVQKGRVVYDGIDVRDIRKDDLRRSLGIVLQDTHLFSGTIADNIRFGKLDATREEVERAARIANADSFIRRLPKGYDTMVTADGASLSQGQRQLLAIARAAVEDPPVLILDEATSSIDTRTEALIEKGMDGLMQGRTVFVIAHRLSTVRNADAIMVLDHGRIVERGDHEELLRQKGMYYQLYHGMFELS